MKIGSIDILKAYLGALELVSSNAFIGSVPIISGGPTPVGYAGLKMKSTGNSTIGITFGSTSSAWKPVQRDLKYSLDDGNTWTQWDYSVISLTDGQSVCFKGNNSGMSYRNETFSKFTMTGSIAVSGNIMSLIDDGACTTLVIPSDYGFNSLFRDCTSLTTAPALPATTITNYCYGSMFSGCTALTTAPTLPATTVGRYSYYNMFYGCTSLTTAPVLPATTLADYCYQLMFAACDALTTAPVLPATTLATGCYHSMFAYCDVLTTAPVLPATTLTVECYYRMFYNCPRINNIECLATDVSANGCTTQWLYRVADSGTFMKNSTMNNWTLDSDNGIPTGWAIPVEYPEETLTFTPNKSLKFTVNENGYFGFSKLHSTNPVYISKDNNHWAQVTTIGTYEALTNEDFYVCGTISSISTTSDYTQFRIVSNTSVVGDVMSLYDYTGVNTAIGVTRAFYRLFKYCSKLATGPELPATTLSDSCYQEMFYNCTSLVTAPELPATTLVASCYKSMFYGCTLLNYIKCYANSNISQTQLSQWVWGVAITGTFVAVNSENFTIGTNGIPSGWSTGFECLKMTVTGHAGIYLQGSDNKPVDVKYSLDNGSTWTQWQYTEPAAGKVVYDTIDVTDGTILFKGSNSSGFCGLNDDSSLRPYSYMQFRGSFYNGATVAVSGNIMSLINDGNNKTTAIPNNYCFMKLFQSFNLTSVPMLPATTLKTACYQGMFDGCGLLTGISDSLLQATSLQTYCYDSMFRACGQLTSVTKLPATSLSNSCYQYMFYSCTALTTVPSDMLSFTNTANYCCYAMFGGCSALTGAPDLLPTLLKSNCYSFMFNSCSSLTYIKCLAKSGVVSNTQHWVSGVAASGTFIKNPNITVQDWTTGNNAIPSGWTVQDAA